MAGVIPGLAILSTLSYFVQLEVNYLEQVARKQFLVEDKETLDNIFYDFIVVGAGTAGCLVASKLSQSHRVLLLEQGGPAPSLTSVPGFRNYMFNVPIINHQYYSTKQRNLNHRRIYSITGKMVGGSFAHNELYYVRGHKRNYENWARITKDNSYGYKNIAEMYKELESYSGPFPSKYRGTTGPIPIHVTDTPTVDNVKRVAKELGYTYNDPNGPMIKEGFTPMDSTASKDGRAVTTCSLLVDPINGLRRNLKVVTYANVEKIKFQGDVATGVEYSRFGYKFYVGAKKEVILSAVSYGSPLLLFKSGIGPRNMLAKAKIPLVVDLPVGKELKDHFIIHLNLTMSSPPKSLANVTLDEFNAYLTGKRDGVLSEVGVDAQGFFVSKTATSKGEQGWPDIQIAVGGHDNPAITVILDRLDSSGTLMLHTKRYAQGERDNTKLARIDNNYLDNPDDMRRVIDGLRIAQQIVESSTMQQAGWKLVPHEECAGKEMLNSDAYWTCFLKARGMSGHHPSSTCRMGFGKTDKGATVGPKFEVLGVRCLRIVDASVMPEITTGNINAPTMILATKASNDIVNKYE